MVKELLEREGWGCGDHACQNRLSKTQGSSQALTARKALGQDTSGRPDASGSFFPSSLRSPGSSSSSGFAEGGG